MTGLLSILSAFGLSTAAGLNAYIPLLTVGLLARYTDLIHLNAPYDVVEHPVFLLVVAVLTLLDFIGDKIPAVDHALHLAGMIISPAAGAIVFLAANSSTGAVDPVLAAICGILAAGATHVGRSAVRPVATATTGGVANPVVSAIEDLISLLVSILAVLAPILAIITLALFAIVVVRFIRRIWSPRRTASSCQ
ncbi:DUF4126 domain-containing protein [Roseiflexus sp.]|uniref:DUF4126 domain-containing protein n=1 Tax=Roseiflexus sp. TaxID=2562120 RepID=UPI0021DD0A4B|nr:DUF4126 domain-containing protein [Roseiflexus sp.]GIW02712.1 MAG: hypothetical protein KatS3mg058_4115 [Roseiflexus sp.]